MCHKLCEKKHDQVVHIYLKTRPCSGLILTSYNRVDSANSIDDKLSVAIDKYKIHDLKILSYFYYMSKGMSSKPTYYLGKYKAI